MEKAIEIICYSRSKEAFMPSSQPIQSSLRREHKTLLFIAFDIDADSQVLAWQQRVGQELSKYYRKTIVVAERVGRHDLPAEIRVIQMPRLFLYGFCKPLKFRWGVLPWLAWKLRGEHIDVVFYHMCFEWAYRLYPLMLFKRAYTGMWYAHGATPWRLRLASRCIDKIFTSSASGFRLACKKLRVIGQAIDLSIFPLRTAVPEKFHIVVVGRLSERKGLHLCLEALAILRAKNDASLEFVGAPLTAQDFAYEKRLKLLIQELGLESSVTFSAPVPLTEIHKIYERSAIHLNLSATGSMDKVVLESLACGCPVLTSNEAYREELKQFPDMLLEQNDAKFVAGKLLSLFNRRQELPPQTLRNLVKGKHDLIGNARQIAQNLADNAPIETATNLSYASTP